MFSVKMNPRHISLRCMPTIQMIYKAMLCVLATPFTVCLRNKMPYKLVNATLNFHNV